MSQSRHAPSPASGLDAAGLAIQHRAAEWLAQRQARGFTLTEQADFADWVAADPRHATIFAEVESAWRTFDRLNSYPHFADLAPDPDLLASHSGRRQSRAQLIPIALAAAAAIAVGGGFWFARSHLPNAPALASAGLAAETQFLRLPDGSTVELNADSQVTEKFTLTERRVQLVRGEAHFSVEKDPARVFVVEADGVAVRAIGTAFNVRLEGKKVEVLVTEGTVKIATPAAAVPSSAPPTAAISKSEGVPSVATLTAGQRTVVPATPSAWTLPPVVESLEAADIERALAWQNNRINFEAIPLAEVVTRLNRYSARNIGSPHLTIRDMSLGELRISGRVRVDQIESFVEVLETSFGVVPKRRANGEIELHRLEQASPREN